MHAPAAAATAATSRTSPAGTEHNACTLTGCGSSHGCDLCSCPFSPLLRRDPPHLRLVLLALQACPLRLQAPQQAWPLSCPVLQRQKDEAPRQAARLTGLSSSRCLDGLSVSARRTCWRCSWLCCFGSRFWCCSSLCSSLQNGLLLHGCRGRVLRLAAHLLCC